MTRLCVCRFYFPFFIAAHLSPPQAPTYIPEKSFSTAKTKVFHAFPTITEFLCCGRIGFSLRWISLCSVLLLLHFRHHRTLIHSHRASVDFLAYFFPFVSSRFFSGKTYSLKGKIIKKWEKVSCRITLEKFIHIRAASGRMKI